tara:strand:- start:585 stop:767 length:183 start_codon:yes stop_codon:yes gene_type:complete
VKQDLTPEVKPSQTSRKYYRYFPAELVNKHVTAETNGYVAYYNSKKSAYETSINTFNTAE